MLVFWAVTLYSLLGHYHHFGGACCVRFGQKWTGQSYEQMDGITMVFWSHHIELKKHSTGQPTTLLVLVCQKYICDVLGTQISECFPGLPQDCLIYHGNLRSWPSFLYAEKTRWLLGPYSMTYTGSWPTQTSTWMPEVTIQHMGSLFFHLGTQC